VDRGKADEGRVKKNVLPLDFFIIFDHLSY
jgi:hypothetical protein